MSEIPTDPNVPDPIVREMTFLERMLSDVKRHLIQFRRRLPYLVWWNDEMDVAITFSQDKLNPEGDIEQLWRGAFAEAEHIFKEMGITFDTGMGCDGRDWEWDWSLKGPISIRFRGRASKPWLRMERPRPKLVISNPAA